MKRYTVCDEANGENGRMHGEVVDQDWVERYMGLDTRRFFINLGGTEQYRKTKSGIIACRSVSPDGKTVREVKFIPIRD